MSPEKTLQKKHHYVYRTTCKVTGRFYVGRHSTNTLDDGYLGSGVVISRSLRKHGKEQHALEILASAENHDGLIRLEKQIVNEDLLQDPPCMNLTTGGHGDFFHVTPEVRRKVAAENGRKNGSQNIKACHTPESKAKCTAVMMARYGRRNANQCSPFKNKQHTDLAKHNIALGHRGKIWITDGHDTRCVDPTKFADFQQLGFRRGRK